MRKTYPRVIDLLQRELKDGRHSKRELARRIGINQNSLDLYLDGVREPTSDSLSRIADYFKTTVAYLREEEERLSRPEAKGLTVREPSQEYRCRPEDFPDQLTQDMLRLAERLRGMGLDEADQAELSSRFFKDVAEFLREKKQKG